MKVIDKNGIEVRSGDIIRVNIPDYSYYLYKVYAVYCYNGGKEIVVATNPILWDGDMGSKVEFWDPHFHFKHIEVIIPKDPIEFIQEIPL